MAKNQSNSYSISIFATGFLFFILLNINASGLEAYSLNVECLINPKCIDVLNPCLSWKLAACKQSEKGLFQEAWQVIVSSSAQKLAQNEGDLWNSGKVLSDETLNITYNGKNLISRQECFWKVKVWDNKGNESSWSKPAKWEMGLLSKTDWKAQWITRNWSDINPKIVQPPVYFRKEFKVQDAKKIIKARVYCASLGMHQIYMDGQKIGNDELSQYTDYNKRLIYQVYDVTDLISKQNEHAIAVILAEGWYRNRSSWDKNNKYTNLVFDRFQDKKDRTRIQLEIDFADGSREMICTSNDWYYTDNGPLRRARMYDGIEYDARKEMNGWDKPNYVVDSSWKPSVLSECPVEIILKAEMIQPVQVIQKFKPISKLFRNDGVCIIDFGQEISGVCSATLKGSTGTTVKIRYAGGLIADSILFDANLAGSKQNGDVYILNGRKQTFTAPFTYHGFRFVEVTGLQSPADLVNIEALAFSNNLPAISNFNSSDQRLNKLWKNILWTHRGNMIGGINTDNTARDERMGWMAEGMHAFNSASYYFDIAAFASKWTQDMLDARDTLGRFCHVSPKLAFHFTSGWSDAGVIIPWVVYKHFDNKRIINNMFDACQNHVSFITSRNPNLIATNGWTERFFHDWLGGNHRQKPDFTQWRPTKTTQQSPPFSKDLFTTAYYAFTSDIVSKMARELNYSSKADSLEKFTERIKNTFQSTFVAQDGSIQAEFPQGAYAQALAWYILSPEMYNKSVQCLMAQLQKDNYHLTTGTHTTHLLLRVLSANGFHDKAWELAMKPGYPSYGFMIDNGATAIWECMDAKHPGLGYGPQNMNDFNHSGFSGVGEWIMGDIAGIRPDEKNAGYKHFFIEPKMFAGPTWVKTTYNSARGNIKCDWKKINNDAWINVTIPPNTTASIVIPVKSISSISESGKAISTNYKYSSSKGETVVNLQSGVYSFRFLCN